MAKYKVDTDKGSYIVETEDPVPGMEKLGGFAPGPAPPRLPWALQDHPEWNTDMTLAGGLARTVAAPVTGLMSVGPEVVNWAKRGGHNAAPTGGASTESLNPLDPLVMAALVEHGSVKPRPGTDFAPSEFTQAGKAVSGGVKGAMKSVRTGRSSLPGIAGGVVGSGLSTLTGIPGLGYLGSLAGAAPELLKGIREGIANELHPPNPHLNKAAVAAQTASTLDPYTNPPSRNPWTDRPMANREASPAPSVRDVGVGAGSMEYGGPEPLPAAKPKAPAPKPKTKAEQEYNSGAAQAGYQPPQDPYASKPMGLPGPPAPSEEWLRSPAGQSWQGRQGKGTGAGPMDFDAPIPRAAPGKGEKPTGKPAETPASDTAGGMTKSPSEAVIEAYLEKLRNQQRPPREPSAPAPEPGAGAEPRGGFPAPPAAAETPAPTQAPAAPAERPTGPLTTPPSEQLRPTEPQAGKAVDPPVNIKTGKGFNDVWDRSFPKGEGHPSVEPGMGSTGTMDMEYASKIAKNNGESVSATLNRWLHEAWGGAHGVRKSLHKELSDYMQAKYKVDSLRKLTPEQALSEFHRLHRIALGDEGPGMPPPPK